MLHFLLALILGYVASFTICVKFNNDAYMLLLACMQQRLYGRVLGGLSFFAVPVAVVAYFLLGLVGMR